VTRTFQDPPTRTAGPERRPQRERDGLDLSPAGMLRLQRRAGNAAATAMVQRLVNEATVRSEAERLWIRKGRPANQTDAESKADWELATRNVGEAETEARRLWEAKGSPAQSDAAQQQDWADAMHTVRRRRLAEEAWRARGAPANSTAAEQAQDWATAGDQLDIEELWERCDPTKPLPGETAAAVPARVQAAKTALAAKPGYRLNMIDAILLHDNGRSPRPFTSVVAEDALGLGGHITTRHVRPAARTVDQEREWQAMRVVTHEPMYGGACPGQAGSFFDVAAANAAIAAALKILWSQNGGWGAPNGWRNKLARGEDPANVPGFWGFQGPITIPVPPAGVIMRRNPRPPNSKFQVAQQPAHFADPAAVGDRPLYPGDPTAFPPMKGGVAIVPQPGNPLTQDVAPTAVTIRVNATPNAAAMGWYVNSAWPHA
jgi:hypothetical protein